MLVVLAGALPVDHVVASPGIVKVFEDLSWEPKAAFGAVAEVYARI